MKIMCDECKGEILSIVEIDKDGHGQCEVCKTTYNLKVDKKIGQKKPENSLYIMWIGGGVIVTVFLCLYLLQFISKIHL